ncbi:acid protease [Trichocladium antarcticum]|uniref:Acid protease n=1 Tax=Trichocladium antarcticum TaxID=1450529 RepID=A0AAN6UPW1_9PEZI|nr:acid protease [Trichocladium antarcticum]
MRLAAATLLALACGGLSQNVVQLNVTKGPLGGHVGAGPELARRGTYAQQLVNSVEKGGYFTQVTVGTPPQTITMLLDTGSSDAWVLGHEADLCTDRDLQDLYGMSCADTYNPGKSSTSKMVKPDGFKIVYLDRGTASGDYIRDDFGIGGVTIESLQMAHVTQAVRGTGILGLGFSVSEKASTKYPNIIDEMANQGLIGCKAYSLYLNDRRTDSGTILFGGIDTDKFIGPLQILPLHRPDGGNYSSFEVNFTSVSVTYTNGTRLEVHTAMLDHPAPAVLDSGTTLSYLPDQMATALNTALGAIYDPAMRTTVIDCTYLTAEPNLAMTFEFAPSAALITVPLWELVLDILPANYHPPPKTPFARACVFGIQSTALFSSSPPTGPGKQPNFTLLGDTFLRSAYAVFDLTHYQIGLAQANLNSSTSTVVELSADGTSLPRATGVTAQQTTFTPTATGGARGVAGDAAATPSENAAPRPSAVALPLRAAEVLGVVAVTGLLTVLGAFIVL